MKFEKYLILLHRTFILVILLAVSPGSFGDWRSGKIQSIAAAYDGSTIAIGHEGYTGTSCTCYPSWPGMYCLDRTRASFQEEYALLLSVKARGTSVSINIDETTCKIIAMEDRS